MAWMPEHRCSSADISTGEAVASQRCHFSIFLHTEAEP